MDVVEPVGYMKEIPYNNTEEGHLTHWVHAGSQGSNPISYNLFHLKSLYHCKLLILIYAHQFIFDPFCH